MGQRSSDGSSDDEWRFSVEDVSDDDVSDDVSDGGDAGAAGEGGSVFGPRPDEGTVEIVPGDPDLENALFVVLGVATSILLVLDLVGVV